MIAQRFIGRIFLHSRLAFWKHIIRPRFLITLIVLLVLSTWISEIWTFRYASLFGIDTFVSVKKPREAQFTYLVTINKDEYERYLGECIEPKRLETVIRTILMYQPAVLAVDIDTSAPRFKNVTIPTTQTPIIWARAINHVRGVTATASADERRHSSWIVADVLGHRARDPEYSGISIFPQDPDSTVRGYLRWVRLSGINSPTLHWEILRAFCGSGQHRACDVITHAEAEDVKVHEFHVPYRFVTIPLGDLISTNENSVFPSKTAENVLRDKIVLIGGAFEDEHPTSFGSRLGVEIAASALEDELNGSGPSRLHATVIYGIKIILALILAGLYTYLRPRYAFAATLLLGIVMLGISFLVFYFEAYRIDFMPFLIGIWIEQLDHLLNQTDRDSQNQMPQPA